MVPIINEIWLVRYKGRLLFVHHIDNRVVGVWIGNRELRTPKAISLIADSDGRIHDGADVLKIETVMYISKIPIGDRLSPTEQSTVLGKVEAILNAVPNDYSAMNVHRAFRTVARTYGPKSTKRHKRIMNIGETIVSRMDPTFTIHSRKQKKKHKTMRRHRGGYTPTARDLKYLSLWKRHKSIGFTMRSSLKAKGLIPRANGTYRVSDKYKTKTQQTRRANRAKTIRKQSRKE